MHMVVGIDEVGRGCWAGPLVAAAVVLPISIVGLKDSKMLTPKKRERLSIQIMQSSLYGLGWVWPNQIDAMGLTAATSLAMALALQQIHVAYTEIIIDGSYNYLSQEPLAQAKIKADQTVPAVSAASILAKVARDNYMYTQATLYPQYGFERHVGYGTATHISALKQYGVCKLHRLSYKPVMGYIV